MKTKKILIGMMAVLFSFSSCNKEEDITTSLITEDEASISAKLDLMNDDVSKIIEEQLNTNNRFERRSAEINMLFVTSCPTITTLPLDLSTVRIGDEIKVTVDFGTAGCELPNKNIVKGKVIVSFKHNPSDPLRTINYSFDNFYHNDVKITGNKTFVRTMTTPTPSHPIITMNMDMTATFPDGKSYTRTGSRTTEIISGYDTPGDYNDNKYNVTGSWTTTYPNKLLLNSEITTPLLVDLSCKNFPITKGIVKLTKNNKTATINYGNGDCDNIALLTTNNISLSIYVGK